MKNPFKYGKAVSGENFCDREKELRDLTSYIRSAQNVFIFANRRIGKTSLIIKVLEILSKKREIIPIYVDLEQVASPSQFVQVYGAAISSALFQTREKLEKIARFFSRIIPAFEITREGGVKITFDFSRTKEKVESALEEVYELPQKIALKYKKRVVVVFDEFQEIEKLNGESFEKKLRAHLQHHRDVCYVFMGSKTRVLIQMFNDPHRAFYKSAGTYPLGPIPKEAMTSFLIQRFLISGKKLTSALAHKIIEISHDIPYYIQLFAWHIWNLSSAAVKEADIEKAKIEVLRSQNELFFNWYDNASMHQRLVLRALAQSREIFSQETIIKHNLGSASSIQASIRKLLKNGLVAREDKKYQIADPFFEAWLREDPASR